jgi:hypothetical protein
MADELLRGTWSYRPSGSKLGASVAKLSGSEMELRATLTPVRRAGRAGHEQLFEVALEHDYHENLGDARCFDFDVYPNVRTQQLMRSLGLLFRNDGSSFSVIYDTSRLEDLAHFLANNRTPKSATHPFEPWTYLSFFLVARNPRLTTVTDIDLSLSPLDWNFYFNNEDFAVLPTPSGRAPSVYKTPLPLRPARFCVDIPEGGMAVIRNEPGVTAQKIDTAERPQTSLGPPYYFDLSQNFEGFYTLDVMNAEERALHLEGKRAPKLDPFIYTLAEPAPLCFFHVLLCRPHPTMKGHYPVAFGPSGEGPRVSTIRYLVRFAPRRTRWVYRVVPRTDLSMTYSIEATSAPSGERLPTFEALAPETEPNGARCLPFASHEDLPLLRRSPYRLRLLGQKKGGSPRVLVDPLPVASAHQVLRRFPEGDEASTTYASHIYVHI